MFLFSEGENRQARINKRFPPIRIFNNNIFANPDSPLKKVPRTAGLSRGPGPGEVDKAVCRTEALIV